MAGNLQENSESVETEPIDYDSGVECSQSQTQSQTDHWGRLYPLKSSLPAIDLVANNITFGKVGTNVILGKDQIPPEIRSKCSKLHFEIHRQQINVMGAPTTRVVIYDKSINGTYINGHVLNQKSRRLQKKVLSSNDVIGLPTRVGSRCYEVYVFIDYFIHPSSIIPYSVRKKYQLSFRLGVGAFGEVSLVFDKEKKKPRALKTIVKDVYASDQKLNTCKQKLLNELDILKTVNHPNVIKLVDVIDCKKEHFLVLEYMEGKDLLDRIQQSEGLDEALTKLYFYQIAQGVKYLHSISIIHRDLKPANILLASCNKNSLVKLTDFGLSKVLSSATMMKTLCGTRTYVAPEVVFGGGLYEYNEQVDIWSLGVVLYVCLSGMEPFASSPEEVRTLIKEGMCSMSSPLGSSAFDNPKDLINRMLTTDPSDRIRIDEVLQIHWIKDDCKMLAEVNALYRTLSDDLPPVTLPMDTSSSSLDLSKSHLTSDPPTKKFRSN